MVLLSSTWVSAEPSRILMLFSNDRLLPANQRYDEGVRRALEADPKHHPVSVYGEFLDATRMGGTEREAAMEEYLQKRYHATPPQVLVALGPEALRFILDRRQSLFPGIPLVFGGVAKGELARMPPLSDAAGLPMEMNLLPIVESLLAMRPETREIFLVHGASPADRVGASLAQQQLTSLAGNVRITDFPELPLEELKRRLASLPKDKAVLYLTYFQSPSGDAFTPAQVAKEISAAASVPVIGPYDTYVGSGVLGVSVSPFEEEGRILGHLISRLLHGEQTETIGLLPPTPPRLILDDRAVKRWKIAKVPDGAELRFRIPSLWEEHRKTAIATIAIVLLQGLLISGLLIARAKRALMQKELQRSEARFSGVFHGSPAAISIARKSDGRIVDVNAVWEQITGVARKDAIGKTALETGLLIGENAEHRYRQFLDSGIPLHDYEMRQRTPDGIIRTISLTSELVSLQDEPCYILLAKDVTAARDIENARQHLAHTSRLAILGEMTASIAHEINQPLGAILSNADAADMLLEKSEPPISEIRTILSDIRRDDMRASKVIKRVRALVGHQEIQQNVLGLNSLVLESFKLVNHEAQRRGVTLVHDLSPELPPVNADSVQIEQVLLNLLLNAMDAMTATHLPSRIITVRSFLRNEESVCLSVEDNGRGIPDDRIGKVFDSFFTTKSNGMGLGLSLARSIAEAHGGSISAHNNSTTGTTFQLILPRYRNSTP